MNTGRIEQVGDSIWILVDEFVALSGTQEADEPSLIYLSNGTNIGSDWPAERILRQIAREGI